MNFCQKKKTNLWLIPITALVLIAMIVCFIYVNDYYEADYAAIETFCNFESVSKTVYDDGTIVYSPESADTALIFYPGGKVEYTAYEPLMTACAEKGVLCVLIEMPCNLAVLDMNAADGICEKFPEIESWYIGGHSLGGSMAASYIEKNSENFDGLVLLGSYSTADLSQADLDVISIYGSEDKVLNGEKYEKYRSNLPEDFSEFIIDGGCHAYFGMYGEQDGDGTAAISNEKQIEFTAQKICDWIS